MPVRMDDVDPIAPLHQPPPSAGSTQADKPTTTLQGLATFICRLVVLTDREEVNCEICSQAT